MKKLKTIFSPRKLLIWLAVIILIFTAPQINGAALDETDAIVTMVFVDKQEENIKVSAAVLTPTEGKAKNQIIFSGTGRTFDSAVENISLAIGKEMGFAQCQVMGFGANICTTGIMTALDYMTRTKKVGRNAILVDFEGDVEDFAQAMSDLNTNNNLSLNQIISFDNRYTLAQDSNIESFYIGYFSDLSLGIVPHLKLSKQKMDNAIEVSSNSSGGTPSNSGSSGGQSGEDKMYFLNDGSIGVFKRGKKQLNIPADMVKKLNMYINNGQQGTMIVEGVTDNLYDDATVVVNVVKKQTKLTADFKNNIPVYSAKIDLTVMVEEVVDNLPPRSMLRRNQEFLTPTLVKKLKQKVQEDALDIIEYCKQNSIDVLNVYKNFYRKKHKDWQNYMNTTDIQNYLQGVMFNVDVNVSSEF